jgi:uncharacterized protein YegJ (DUF2314 family)
MAGKSRRSLWIGLGIVVVLVGALVWSSRAKPSGVVRVAHESPELQAAALRAQNELEDFVKELTHPKEGERFAVKGAFKTDQGPEYLWVRDPVYSADGFRGTLDQVPMLYHGAKKGDDVTVKREDVYDWMIREGKDIRGAYTEEVLRRGG